MVHYLLYIWPKGVNACNKFWDRCSKTWCSIGMTRILVLSDSERNFAYLILFLMKLYIDSLVYFSTIFLLKMSFILSFYIYFTFIKCCTKYKIPKFIIPTLIHQLWNNFYIYIKCIYTNYVVNIRHIRHQIDKLCGRLPPVLVYSSGVAQIIVSSITGSEFTSLS